MKIILLVTILFSGLMAGLFFGYSCSVNPGLRSLSHEAYLRAMQSINAAIQNPVFFTLFMGLLLLFPVISYQLYGQQMRSFYWMAGSALVYFSGVFGITLFCNVPLNEQLARFVISQANEAEIFAMREAFEEPWNKFHTLRTAASVLSFGLSVISLLKLK